MNINGDSNPFRAPQSQEEDNGPKKESLTKTVKRGLALTTLMSAPIIAAGTAVDEYQDAKPATFQSVSNHFGTWCKRILPNGFAFGMGAAAFTRNKKKDDEDGTKPQQ